MKKLPSGKKSLSAKSSKLILGKRNWVRWLREKPWVWFICMAAWLEILLTHLAEKESFWAGMRWHLLSFGILYVLLQLIGQKRMCAPAILFVKIPQHEWSFFRSFWIILLKTTAYLIHYFTFDRFLFSLGTGKKESSPSGVFLGIYQWNSSNSAKHIQASLDDVLLTCWWWLWPSEDRQRLQAKTVLEKRLHHTSNKHTFYCSNLDGRIKSEGQCHPRTPRLQDPKVTIARWRG